MNEFEIKSNMIAMEALQMGLPITLGSPTFLKVKGIAKAIAGWAREKVRPDMRVSMVSYAKIRKDMEKANVADLTGVKVTVPRGLKTYLNVYVEDLFDSFLLVENINNELLAPFSMWLSMMLASPQSLADASAVNDLKNYKEIPVDKVRTLLAKFVDPTSRRDTMEFKEVYPSLTVMKMTWDNINAMTTRYLETNPTRILKTVQEIAGKVDRLIHVVEENDGSLSGPSATIMAKLVAQMAEAVDMYGQIGVLVRELAVVGTRNVGELEKAIVGSSKKVSKMAMESLSFDNPMLEFEGRKVDFETLKRIIYRFGEERLIPIEQFDWVIEEGVIEAAASGALNDYDERTVYAVFIGDTLLPVDNLEVIAMAAAAGHRSVQAQVIEKSTVIEVIDANKQDSY